MLRSLTISDFVLVDRLELDFQPGFSVLTGETGAGKSILLDALALTLGERADAGNIREGAERAEISAEFDCRGLTGLDNWLREQDLEGDPDTCLLRRSIERSGRSRAFINGRAVTLQQLKEAGDYLIDIHGQHAHYSLLQPAAQRKILDEFGGCRTLADQVAVAYQDWQKAIRRCEEATRLGETQRQERERLLWVVSELSGLGFAGEAWQSLQETHRRLSHALELLEGVRQAHDLLAADESGALGLIRTAHGRLQELADFDPGLAEPLQLLDSTLIEVSEAAHELLRYADRLELDPAALSEAESRISAVTHMARKFRIKPEDIPELLESTQRQLAELDQMADLEGLTAAEQIAAKQFMALAGELSEQRRRGAGKLSKAVSQCMQTLSMKGGQFKVELKAGSPDVHGMEAIEFLVSPHPGQGLRPLSKTASGGELSRIGLALQTVLSGISGAPTLIFDEVDSGIGGGVAEIVGRMLADLGKHRQILCVTHLPQVASMADQHWQVSKQSQKGRTTSHVERLGPSSRVDEIARMLGGVKITETTRRHAEELLGLARSA